MNEFLNFEHRISFASEDFLVTKANEAAAYWLKKWPHWPLFGQSPAFFLHGPPQAGKSHYLHVFAQMTDAHVVNVTELDSKEARHNHNHNNSPLIVDDIHLLRDNDEQARCLFHLINDANLHARAMLLASREMPCEWSFLTHNIPDLISRLQAFPIIYLATPDEPLVAGLLLKAIQERGLTVNHNVMRWIIPRLPRSHQDIVRFVEMLSDESARKKTLISRSMVKSIFAKMNWHG